MDDSSTPLPPFMPPLVPLGRILAGQDHAPVVYFARVSGGVKIGWTTNLAARMHALYIPVSGVLAVVPGGQAVENSFHELFAAWQVDDGRAEVFDIEPQMGHLLADTGRPASAWRAERWASPARRRRPAPARPSSAPPPGSQITREAVLPLLARPGGVSTREVAVALTGDRGCHQTAWRRLHQLEADGLAELRDIGSNRRFYITAAGLAALADLAR